MTPAAALRRQFVAELDARRRTYVTDGRRLLEVVATKGVEPVPAKVAVKVGIEPAVKLLDCADPLPVDRFEELDSATWVPVEEAVRLDVVEPIGDDGGK